MQYTSEFIKELPASMQAEVSTLAAQIEKLSKEKKKLKLPGDAVASYELIESNKIEALRVIEDAKQQASQILLEANNSADSLLQKANKLAFDISTEATRVINTANEAKKDAENTLDFAKRVQATTQDSQRLLEIQKGNLLQDKKDFYTLVKTIKDFLPDE